MADAIEVLAPGPLLSIQDQGRSDSGRYGVPRGGAVDRFALVAANRLVGNPPDAAALEITAGGAVLRFLRSVVVALAGADYAVSVGGVPLPPWCSVRVPAGAELRFGQRRGGWGARTLLAVAGGLDVPLVLGARATALGAGFGGWQGRALRAGDRLPVGVSRAASPGLFWPEHARPAYAAVPCLRVLSGPHTERCFDPAARERFVAQPYIISPTSNRQGYRLDGARLSLNGAWSLPSFGVLPGCIQVPADGAPILLLADAQPTGGYPVIGVVIGPDLSLAAQLLPGDALSFRWVENEEAQQAFLHHEAMLDTPLFPDPNDLALRLAGSLD